MTVDPLTDIMAPSCFGTDCPPIYRETGADLGFFPDIQPLTIERVARIYDVPVELVDTPRYRDPEEEIRERCSPEVADGVVRLAKSLRIIAPEPAPEPERYGRWLHPEEIPQCARRPWVAVEQLDATQQIPVIRGESCE
jgi:hypothetical protein